MKNILLNLFNSYSKPIHQKQIKQLLLQAKILSSINRNFVNLKTLTDVEYSVFSQWGEDGIINWLIENIPNIPSTFVEFGVENYTESNTRLLLKLKNWSGLVIDGSEKNISEIKRQEIYWRYQIKAKREFIDVDNINKTIRDEGFSGDIGILSIDIDGNDYWVWRELNVINPAIVIIEYNAVLGDLYELTVPYRKDFIRSLAHRSNLYFGASLPALIKLGSEKNYTFVGTNSNGCNAFFVRNDLAKFTTNLLLNITSYPSRFRESRDNNNNLLFLNGIERVSEISHLPLMDLTNGKLLYLNACKDIYSNEWLLGNKKYHD